MLEYFSYKKIKKHQAEKKAEAKIQTPLITEEDENFLTRIVSAEGTPPPLPERPHSTEVPDRADTREDDPVTRGTVKQGKDEQIIDRKKSNRFSFIHRRNTKKNKLQPVPVVSTDEANKEEDDINRVLDDLNLAAVNNRAFSISKESQELVQKFTVILKDLVNGVPTAYDDLVHLLEDSQNTLSKSYEHLPSFLKKLITQLPDKMTKYLAPELLVVATEAQGLNTASASSSGLGGFAKNFFKFSSLKELVAKPGAVVSLLKTILNALKVRWPAFMGTNVLLSLALFVLLFFFWYCHKRGKETRLERAEKENEKMTNSEGRITELEDDPMLEGASNGTPQETGHESSEKGKESQRPKRKPVSANHSREPSGSATPIAQK